MDLSDGPAAQAVPVPQRDAPELDRLLQGLVSDMSDDVALLFELLDRIAKKSTSSAAP